MCLTMPKLINKSFLFGVTVTLLIIIIAPVLLLKILPYFYEPPAMKVSSIEPQKLPAVADRSVFSEITEHCLLYKDLEQPFDERRLPREAEKQFCDCYRYGLDYLVSRDKELDLKKYREEVKEACLKNSFK